MKDIVYSTAAKKTLRKMPANTSTRITSKVEAYAKDPASQANNVKALKGEAGAIRLRVGSWRIIMLDAVVVEVIRIAARGSAY